MKYFLTRLFLFWFTFGLAATMHAFQLVPSADARTDSLEQLGMKLYAEGRFNESVATFCQLDSTRYSARLYDALGMGYASLNDVQAALRYLRRAVECDPLDAAYRYHFARTLAQSGATIEAQREFQLIIDHDPTYVAAYMQIGQGYYERKLYDSALVFFSHVMEVNPRDYLTYYLAASSLVGLREYDSARTFLAACMAFNPSYTSAVVLLASIYFSVGDHREALRLYSLASLQRPTDADLRFKSGLCSEKLNEVEKALVFFRQAIAIDSTNDAYYAQIGYTYLQRHRYDSAAAAYERASALDPDNSLYLINLGYSLQKMDDARGAVDAYTRAIVTQHPENIALVYVRLGTLCYFEKRYHDALAAYMQAIAYNPKNTEAQFYLALTHDQLSDKYSAIRQYQKYLKLAADDTARQERERKTQARGRINYLKRKQ